MQSVLLYTCSTYKFNRQQASKAETSRVNAIVSLLIEHVKYRSPAQGQHPSPMHGGPGPIPGPGLHPTAPGPHLNGPGPHHNDLGPGQLPAAPGPHHNGPGPGPLLQPPAAVPIPRGPPQPLTQFPVELGNFINKLPPARALEGAHPNVDQVTIAYNMQN